jgi:DNA-binding beta-propeller fold protein YncE
MPLGEGTHVYNVVENWAKLPADVQPGYTHGVVTDKQDQVYVFNQSKTAIIVFDRAGNYLRSWGEQFAAGAHGLMINDEQDEQFLYLADYEQQCVVKTTLDGRELLRIGVPPHQPTQDQKDKYKPTWTTIGPNGNIYITDGYGIHYIHQYDKGGNYIRSWGGTGDAQGQMTCPHGITVITSGGTPEIYVADRANVRLQVFDLEGNFKRFVAHDLRHPCVVIEKDGVRYIPDLYGRITILDADDKLICHFGDYLEAKDMDNWPNIPHEKRQIGRFSSPHGLWVDSHDDLYIVEWVEDGRITKLERQK